MKLHRLPLFLLLACLAVFTATSCDDDEDDFVADVLRYDTENVTGPIFPAADIFAAYFPPSEVAEFRGRTLDRVEFVMWDVPSSTELVIFAAGPDGNAPGAELFRRDLTARVNGPRQTISYRLDETIIVPDEGIWLAVEVGSSPSGQTVGCDDGSNYNSNGDRARLDNGTWSSFLQVTGSEAVNWNIRGFLADE